MSIALVQSASLASILGLYFTVVSGAERPGWHILVISVCIAVFLLTILQEIRDHLSARPKAYSTAEQIRKYLQGWISKGGRVCIFSRDMSWADDPLMKEALLTKARRRELIICLEEPTPLSEKLAAAGAEIVIYGLLDYVPNSRFTIINFERQDAQVAVGGIVGEKHLIQEFRQGQHPYFFVADDLVRLMINYGRRFSNNATKNPV